MTSARTWQERIEGPLRQVVRFLRLPAGLAALAGVALSLAVHVASIWGIDTEAWANVWLLHVALLPLVILAVLTAGVVAHREERLRFRDFIALIPMPSRVLVVLGLVYAIATLLIFTPLSGAGAPVVKDGRFFFDNHGAIREVTESQFHFQRSLSLRLFSSVWLYLYFFSATYLLGAKRQLDH